MDRRMFMLGIVILFLSLVALGSLNVVDNTINGCAAACRDLNMSMLMISSEYQCVCENDDYPGIRRYPWMQD